MSLTRPSKQLRTLRTKLDKAINGSPLQDPFAVLPRELVALILNYLDLKDLLDVPFPCILDTPERYSDSVPLEQETSAGIQIMATSLYLICESMVPPGSFHSAKKGCAYRNPGISATVPLCTDPRNPY